ncbi:MAG: FAD-binding oxidoreductase, partial [Acidimicrobiia bacterium]|nr:FAD-binding oxidoreductase [Acidimicrobiia bacterium]
MTTEKLNLRTLDGGEVDIDLSLLETIPGKGRLRPGDPGYDDATLIWNGLIDKEPALVIRPENSDEVAFAVNLAREHRLLLSIKGGGH